MLRIMLNQVFGCDTYTKYLSPTYRPGRNSSKNPTGVKPLPGAWPECIQPMAADEKIYFVKTHDRPEDDSAAIYLVRNGFAAVRSYQCYLKDLNGITQSLEQIILGEPQFRSWGWHLDGWDPLARRRTLLLKYEDLVEQPQEQLKRIAEFTGLSPQGAWVNEFEKWQQVNPKMFRQGHDNSPTAGFSAAQQELFWSLHGDWMSKLGYGIDGAKERVALREAICNRLHAVAPAAPISLSSMPAMETQEQTWWRKLTRKSHRK